MREPAAAVFIPPRRPSTEICSIPSFLRDQWHDMDLFFAPSHSFHAVRNTNSQSNPNSYCRRRQASPCKDQGAAEETEGPTTYSIEHQHTFSLASRPSFLKCLLSCLFSPPPPRKKKSVRLTTTRGLCCCAPMPSSPVSPGNL